MLIDLFTKAWNLYKKKQSQDTINRFIKTLVKLFSENHTDKRMYVRLVADKPSEIQHYWKSLSDWTTQNKNWNLVFHKLKVKNVKE